MNQTNPVGIELFTYVKTSLFQEICIATDRLSENDLLYVMCKIFNFYLNFVRFVYITVYLFCILFTFFPSRSSKCMFTVNSRCYRCDEIP